MRSFIKIFIAIVILVSLLTKNAVGQKRNKYKQRNSKSKSIGKYKGNRTKRYGISRFNPYGFSSFGINALNYYGDLAPSANVISTDLTFTRPGAGLYYGYKFHPSMSFRIGYNYGILYGDDYTSDPRIPDSKYRYHRNLSFRNQIHELSIGMEFYLLPEYRGYRRRPPLNMYLFLGIAGFYHNPQAKTPDYDYQLGETFALPDNMEAGSWVDLQPLGTEGQYLSDLDENSKGKKYSLWQVAIPIGIGAAVTLTHQLSLGMEFNLRVLFFDYIDDVGDGLYVSLEEFDNPTSRIFSARGAEPTAVVSGKPRSGLEIGDNNGFRINTFELGGALNPPGTRGGSHNDLYTSTQIKLIYILSNNRGRRRAKFR